MLDLRFYRVTLLPFAVGLIIVAFSLHTTPTALRTAQPGATFSASTAARVMTAMAAGRGDPAPGTARDDALARAFATFHLPYGLAGANFQSVRIVRTRAQTTAGAQTIESVIATRAGTGPGIALIADRGGPGPASGLAPTAILLEIADAFSALSTQHPLTLVSTSGGASGLAAVARLLPAGIEGAIVIGEPPNSAHGSVSVVPWSTAGGVAPAELRRTVEAAFAGGLGVNVGDVALADQFARIALPLTVGAQGPLLANGIPAVLVTAGGEDARSAASSSRSGAPVAVAQLGAFGQSLAAAALALDAGPALATAPTRDLSVGSQTLDGWGVRLLAGLLLVSLAGCTLDVLARARRRKVPVARAFGWVLSFAAPFLLAGLFAVFLGAGGLLPATPAAPVTSAQLPPGGAGVAALLSVGLLFILSWLLRSAARRGRRAPQTTGSGAALLVTGCVLAFFVWLGNPFTALLVIVPLHVWLLALTRERERTPLLGLLALLASLAAPLAALALVCVALHLSPPGLAWTLVLLIAGGGVSIPAIILGAVACGCAVAAGVLLLAPAAAAPPPAAAGTRRTLGYAGPGSLGGTASALRR